MNKILFIILIFTKKINLVDSLNLDDSTTNRLLSIRTSRYGEIGRHAALRKQCESISVRVRVAADFLRKEIQYIINSRMNLIPDLYLRIPPF
uniref:Ribosomal protein S15 n=1 Tax=Torilis scabra TaxID=79188 RepID=A0A650DRS2_9APIA|nr:ribosomal protein S15 [Torilis scabra]